MFSQRQWVAVFVVATVAVYLGFASRPSVKVDATSNATTDSSNQENGQSSMVIIARPLRAPKVASATPIAAKDAESVYRDFKKSKTCFLLKGQTTDDLLEEISELKETIHQVSAEVAKQVRRQIESDEALLQQKKDCSQDTPLTQNGLRELLATAARMGNIDAQFEYAKHPMIDPFHVVADFDSIREWRNSAPRYINDLATRGNQKAILLLAEAMDPFQCHAANSMDCGGRLGDALPDSAMQSYGYYRLLQLVAGNAAPAWVPREMSALETLMSADEIADANRQAQESYQRVLQRGASS